PGRRRVAESDLRRPRGVVNLHRDEGELEVPRQARRLVEVHGGRPGDEGIVRALDVKTVAPDRLDLLGPRIDEGDVVSGAGEVTAKVAPDRAGSDEHHALLHGSSWSSVRQRLWAAYGFSTRTGASARNAWMSSRACG